MLRLPIEHVFLGNVVLFEEFSSFHLLLELYLTYFGEDMNYLGEKIKYLKQAIDLVLEFLPAYPKNCGEPASTTYQ